MCNFYPQQREEFIDDLFEEPFTKDYQGQKENFSDFIAQLRLERTVVEEAVLEFINALKLEKNVILVGLTARKKTKEARVFTERELSSLGIDFKQLSKLGLSTSSLPDHKNFDLNNGICYTGEEINKVELIPSLVELIAQKMSLTGPFTAFHIDDSRDEIKAFKTTSAPDLLNATLIITPILYTANESDLNYWSNDDDGLALTSKDILKLFQRFKEKLQ